MERTLSMTWTVPEVKLKSWITGVLVAATLASLGRYTHRSLNSGLCIVPGHDDNGSILGPCLDSLAARDSRIGSVGQERGNKKRSLGGGEVGGVECPVEDVVAEQGWNKTGLGLDSGGNSGVAEQSGEGSVAGGEDGDAAFDGTESADKLGLLAEEADEGGKSGVLRSEDVGEALSLRPSCLGGCEREEAL